MPNEKLKRCCNNYRERISECRNCDYSDAFYKECFVKKVRDIRHKYEKGDFGY